MDLKDLLRAAAEMKDSEPRESPETILARLRARAALFREADAGPRFAVGEVITPLKDGTLTGAGEPHVVVSTRPAAEYDFSANRAGINTFGAKFDIRVLSVIHGNIVAHWGESSEFERWFPASA